MNKDDIEVSVVVPIYNAEPYISCCLESIHRQSMQRMEVILIDDGSTDQSAEVLDAAVLFDTRFRVIHQANKGVSEARNVGVQLARGIFIAFVDADDTIEPDYIELLFQHCKDENADISVCDCGYKSVCTGKEALCEMLYQKRFDTAPWGKMFRRELVQAVPFPQGIFFEDLAVICRVFSLAHKVVLFKKGGYHYRRTPDGTMNGRDPMRLLNELTAADMMHQFVVTKFPDLKNAATCRKFSAYCQVLMKLPRRGYKQEKIRVWNELERMCFGVMRDQKARIKNRAAALMVYFSTYVLRYWRGHIE